jgi:DNA-binding transcriptional LysR family regulator
VSRFDLRRLDLNLVTALQALLEERNVSAAAQRLSVTQPAASKSLQKLRRHFGDELLIRDGREHRLTPLAAGLLPEVQAVVEGLGELLGSRSAFDAAATHRNFVLAGSDYTALVLGRRLTELMTERAPHASLTLARLSAAPIHEQLSGVDGVVVPPGQDRLDSFLPAFSDVWCCVVDDDLVESARGWTRAEFVRRGFVAAGVHGHVPARDFLERAGVEVHVRITTATFSAVPFLVTGTPYVGVLHRRMADVLAGPAGLSIVETPWASPAVHLRLYFDEIRAQDPGTRWFLDLVAEAARSSVESSED